MFRAIQATGFLGSIRDSFPRRRESNIAAARPVVNALDSTEGSGKKKRNRPLEEIEAR
jgi:hypothetical protein